MFAVLLFMTTLKLGFHCNASISVRRMHKGKEDFNIVKLLFYACVYACASKSVMLTLKFTASENQG